MKFFLNVFLFSVQFVLIFCDIAFDYCSLNDNVCEGTAHIACGTLESKLDKREISYLDQINITLVQLSSNEKNSLLNFINGERNKIAVGQTMLPKGSNLPKTVWDDELELFAKAFAEFNLFGNAQKFCFKRRNGQMVYGIVSKPRSSKTSEDSIQQLVLNYEEEDLYFYRGSIESLKEVALFSKMGCYFGHLAWRKNTDLYEGALICVIDYGVKRSAVGDLFLEGVPCSACKNDVGCDSDFAGLCA